MVALKLSGKADMSNVKQLLAKAMSTSSEDEAIACLRMARKKSNSLDLGSGSVEYKGKTAEYWYDKANMYYQEAKKRSDTKVGLSAEEQVRLYQMYQNSEKENVKLCEKYVEIRSENSDLKRKLETKKNEYIAGLFLGLMISMMLAIIFALIF